jgi:hypothetical protein
MNTQTSQAILCICGKKLSKPYEMYIDMTKRAHLLEKSLAMRTKSYADLPIEPPISYNAVCPPSNLCSRKGTEEMYRSKDDTERGSNRGGDMFITEYPAVRG